MTESEKKAQMHNIGIAASGQDVETSAVCIAVLWFGLTSFNLAFVVNFNFPFSIGSGPGWTNYTPPPAPIPGR